MTMNISQYRAPLLIGLALLMGACAKPTVEDAGLTVQVSGRGEIKATPDQAVINASLQLQGKESRPLLQQADAIMEQAIAALLASGVEDTAINAGQLQLNQRWAYANGKQHSDGYEIQRPLSITLSDIRRYPEMIDVLSKQGINTFNGVSFEYSNRQLLLDQAVAAAVNNAQHQAEVAAEAAQAKHCTAKALSLGGSHFPTPRLEVAKMAMAADNSGAYNPGEQSLSASVSATFICK